MSNIYFGIDGTDNYDAGALGNQPNNFGDAHSHVKKICALGFDKFKYIGGPTDRKLGWSTDNLAREAIAWISSKKDEDRSTKVHLGGFSRGGAAQIYVAHKLKDKGIDVEAMYLFDAVDRTWSIPNEFSNTIPSNVKSAYHAVRSEHTGSRGKGSINFGNCGMKGADANLEIRYFFSTHGGMGGWRHDSNSVTGDGTIKEDAARKSTSVTLLQELSASMVVWGWMEGKVRLT